MRVTVRQHADSMLWSQAQRTKKDSDRHETSIFKDEDPEDHGRWTIYIGQQGH